MPALLTLAFGLVAGLGLLHHEFWRDELHVWLLCAESEGIADLFRNMSTEWHPALWYLFTWLLTKVTQHAEVMQFISLAFGMGSVWLVARHGPFSWPVKILLCTGYHFLFEYTIISRVYSAELFLLLLSVNYISRLDERNVEWKAGLSLLALSLTVIHGTLITCGLIFYMLLRQRKWKSITLGATGVLFAVCHVTYQAIAAGYLDDRYYASPTHDLAWLSRVFTSFLNGMIPFPNWNESHFWNTHPLRPISMGVAFWIGVAVTIACLALMSIWLWKNKPLLVSWILALIGIYFLIGFMYEGFTRHHGQFFLASLAVLWIMGKQSPLQRWKEAVLAVMLGVSWIGGAYAYVQDWQRPFSNGKMVADYLSAIPLADANWAASLDFCATPVAYHGGKKIFSAQSGNFTSWIWWAENSWDRTVTQPQAMVRFDSLHKALGKPIAVILSSPPNLELDRGNHMHLFPGATGRELDQLFFLKKFDNAIVEDENFLVYALGNFEGNEAHSLLAEIAGREPAADLPDTSSKVKQHFDQHTTSDSLIVLSGWAFLKDLPNEGVRQTVVLKGTEYGYRIPAVRHFREDVRDAFQKECNTDSAGFHATIPLSWVKPDTYQVGIHLVNGKLEQGLIYSDTLVVPASGK